MQKSNLMNNQKKAVIWGKWESGIPMIEIARTIGKPPATVFSNKYWLSQSYRTVRLKRST